MNPNLQPLQFKYSDANPENHAIYATHPDTGEEMGRIKWAKKEHTSASGYKYQPGEISYVEAAVKRQGIGTALYNAAVDHGPQPLHSRNFAGPSGKKFAKAVGGPSVEPGLTAV